MLTKCLQNTQTWVVRHKQAGELPAIQHVRAHAVHARQKRSVCRLLVPDLRQWYELKDGELKMVEINQS